MRIEGSCGGDNCTWREDELGREFGRGDRGYIRMHSGWICWRIWRGFKVRVWRQIDWESGRRICVGMRRCGSWWLGDILFGAQCSVGISRAGLFFGWLGRIFFVRSGNWSIIHDDIRVTRIEMYELWADYVNQPVFYLFQKLYSL